MRVAAAPRGRHWGKAMRAALWNTRSALLYSIGGWTVLGGLLHYSYSSGGGHEDESDHKANEEHSRDVVIASKPLGLNVTTVITYHKELPPLTRLLRRMTAYFTPSSSPPSSEN